VCFAGLGIVRRAGRGAAGGAGAVRGGSVWSGVVGLLDVVGVNEVLVVSVGQMVFGSDVKMLMFLLNVYLDVFWACRRW